MVPSFMLWARAASRVVRRYRLSWLLGLQLIISGCGGGTAETITPPPPPPPIASDFSLHLPQSFSLQQGGAPYLLGIGSGAGTAPDTVSSVTVTFPNLPPGLTAWPRGATTLSPLFLQSENLYIYASSTAAPGQFTLDVLGTSGSITHQYSIPVTVNPSASFHLSVSPPQLSLTPGSPQNVQVTVVPNSGAVPAVNFTTSTLPARLDFANPVIAGAQPGPFTFTFSSTTASLPLSNFPIFITATGSSGDTSTFTLPVSLSVPFPPITAPTRSTILRTDDSPAGAVYDPARKLVFFTLPNLNEVQVVSSVDAHHVATISAFHPVSIDESFDGSQIFVGSLGQIIVIDPDLLQVMYSRQTVPQSSPSPTQAVQLLTLSNGDVLYLSTGQPFLWNPSNSSTTRLMPGFQITGAMKRSADRSTVLLASGNTTLLYDVASGTFGSPGLGIPSNTAINPNGNQIAAITTGNNTAGFLSFYDGNFNLLSSSPIYTNGGLGQLIYSLDGKTLYTFTNESDVAFAGSAYNTATFLPEGLFAMGGQPTTYATSVYAIDETGMIFGSSPGGTTPYFVFTDASHPGAMAPDSALEQPTNVGGSCGGSSGASGISAPNPPVPFLEYLNLLCFAVPPGLPVGLRGSGFDPNSGYNLFVGPPPASKANEAVTDLTYISGDELDFKFPGTSPNNTPGPVNLTLTRGDGSYQMVPDGFSYGPTAFFVDPSAIPASGQTVLTLWGYNLLSPTVTIGGAPAAVISAAPYDSNVGLTPLQQLQITAPPGAPGLADVTIADSEGSITLPSAVQYLSNDKVFPVAGTLASLVYDRPRQRVYITNYDHNRIEIFDINAQSFLTPVSVGNGPTALALTPDDSKLAVVNSTDSTISVIDPGLLAVTATYSAATSQDQSNCRSMLANVVATIQPHLAVVGLSCPAVTHVLNLDTGLISCVGVPGCDASGTVLNIGFPVVALSSTPTGSRLSISGSFDEPTLLDLTTNGLFAPLTGLSGVGAGTAIDGDGNVFANGLAIYASEVVQNLPGGASITSAAVPISLGSGVGYFQTIGEFGSEALNPSGSLLFISSSPVTGAPGIDVYDVHQGKLAMRIALPELPLPVTAPQPFRNLSSLALDEAGSKIFVLTTSGLTIAQLANVPLSIGSVVSGPGATSVTIRGSNFQPGAAVSFGTTKTSVTFVDSMTLVASLPALPSGPVQVTVTNPDGHSYSLDAAYTVP